ncbi:hypothetical protein [Clostridium tarantellae]|uniref:hypothetical protein n=1 Tax=Clostridium tarantellae TaxID=39493 RepID=UPI0014793DB5|nr:hypothetical protein [Clostridium tarantellae]
MRNLKEESNSKEEKELEPNNCRLHNRSYYNKHLTSNILTTKLSYIPNDSLF